MTLNYLLSHNLKKVGWMILIPSAVLGILQLVNPMEPNFLEWTVPALLSDPIIGNKQILTSTTNNVLDEILMVLILLGLLIVAFSREEIEDEFIAHLRLKSLAWATIINYAILLLAIIFIYNLSFLHVLVYNMFTILVFFILLFNWEKRAIKNAVGYEE